MEHSSDSDENDADFVLDENELSDNDSESKIKSDKNNTKCSNKRLSTDIPITRSKRSRTCEDDKLIYEKNNEKKGFNHSTDKKYEDDLWSKFLSSPNSSDESKNTVSTSKVSDIETKTDDNSCTSRKNNESTTVTKRPVTSKGGNLSNILDKIGKNNKLSTLEKSKQDWNSFKRNEGIEEELSGYNRGKEGYLERQDFLQRTDLRQFEIEKNVRNSRRGAR